MLNTVRDLVGKVETRANKPWITQEMFSKIYERMKQKNVNNEDGRKHSRKLRNEFQSPDKAKTKYLARISDETIEFPRAGCYDLMYMMTKKLSIKKNPGIRNTGTEVCRLHGIVHERKELKFGRIIFQSSSIEIIDQKN